MGRALCRGDQNLKGCPPSSRRTHQIEQMWKVRVTKSRVLSPLKSRRRARVQCPWLSPPCSVETAAAEVAGRSSPPRLLPPPDRRLHPADAVPAARASRHLPPEPDAGQRRGPLQLQGGGRQGPKVPAHVRLRAGGARRGCRSGAPQGAGVDWLVPVGGVSAGPGPVPSKASPLGSWTATLPCPYLVISPSEYVCVPASYQDTSQGVGSTLVTSFYLNHLFKAPLSKYRHIQSVGG